MSNTRVAMTAAPTRMAAALRGTAQDAGSARNLQARQMTARTTGQKAIAIRSTMGIDARCLLVALPGHDHAHDLAAHVRMRHRRALDVELVALEAQEAHLLAADPGLVPGDLDLGDHLVALDPVAAGIGDHGAQRLRAFLV